MIAIRITCIRRTTDRMGRERITHVGGEDWLWPVEDAIRSIRDRVNVFYMLTPGGVAGVRVGRDDAGGPVLRALLDDRWTDHLERLPEHEPRWSWPARPVAGI